MSQNPFAGWSQKQVEEHNARVKAGKSAKPVQGAVYSIANPGQKIVGEVIPGTVAGNTFQMRVTGKARFRPHTDEKKLNRTEQRALAWLQSKQFQWIGIKCWTFKLADDCRLTPDFVTIDSWHNFSVWDCKGGKSTGGYNVEEDSMIKLRVAARTYRFFSWMILWPIQGGDFQVKEIKP